MKKPSPLILLLFTALFTLAGCYRSRQVRERIDRAENIMMDNAPAALQILDSIPRADLKGKANIARFHLVKSMAMYRTNAYASTDSLITIAVDYYSSANDPRRLMQALFLRGDLRMELRRYDIAMKDALRAYDLALKGDDEDWKARCAERIADLFAVTKNYKEALPYNERTINHYLKAGKDRNVLFAKCDQAETLERVGERTKALSIIDSIYKIAHMGAPDSELIAYAITNYSEMISPEIEYNKVIKLLTEKENICGLSPYEKADIASAYLTGNYMDEATKYLEEAQKTVNNDIEQVQINSALSRYYKKTNQLDKLADLYDSAMSTIYKEVTSTLNNTTINGLQDFYQEKNEKTALVKQKIRFIWIISSIIFIAVTFVLIISHRYKIRNKDLEIEAFIGQIRAMSAQITNLSDSQEQGEQQLKTQIENLFREQWNTLNTICNTYYESPDDELTKTLVLQEIKNQIDKISSKKNLTRIEMSVNQNMDNIIGKLREECPNIKSSDITFLTLIIAGFATKTICLFLNLTTSNFYKKRERLITRIKESHAANSELFISKISK